MEEMDNRTNPYTSIHVHRTTWIKLKRLKGKGVSHDRYIRDLLEMPPLERKKKAQRAHAEERRGPVKEECKKNEQQDTGDNS